MCSRLLNKKIKPSLILLTRRNFASKTPVNLSQATGVVRSQTGSAQNHLPLKTPKAGEVDQLSNVTHLYSAYDFGWAQYVPEQVQQQAKIAKQSDANLASDLLSERKMRRITSNQTTTAEQQVKKFVGIESEAMEIVQRPSNDGLILGQNPPVIKALKSHAVAQPRDKDLVEISGLAKSKHKAPTEDIIKLQLRGKTNGEGVSSAQPGRRELIDDITGTKKSRVRFSGSDDFPLTLYNKSDIPKIFQHFGVDVDAAPFVAAAEIFPMRANNYVLKNHIKWNKDVANDPYFKLVIPQPGMIAEPEYMECLMSMEKHKFSAARKAAYVEKMREALKLNAHPAGQLTENVPMLDGKPVEGVQHKYQATMLLFPSEGQYCHAYCTYCFRWQQFTNVGSQQQFKSNVADDFLDYVKRHKHIKDLLFTGGDPMTMSAALLSKYLDPILKDPECSHVQTIRIGTKSLAYWPRRFTTDTDAGPMLDLFRKVEESGRHLSIQAHFTHPVELDTPEVADAIKNIKRTGAVIRTQAPLIKGINDSAATWAEMWNKQTRMGLVPYYMFVERDTGARKFFEVPLARALEIHHEAITQCPGTARTVRGPSMSAGPGKISVLGTSIFLEQKVFVLKFLQARNPHWCAPDKIFYAKFDPEAVWIDDLKPAFGEKRWFWEDEYDEMKTKLNSSSGQRHFTS